MRLDVDPFVPNRLPQKVQSLILGRRMRLFTYLEALKRAPTSSETLRPPKLIGQDLFMSQYLACINHSIISLGASDHEKAYDLGINGTYEIMQEKIERTAFRIVQDFFTEKLEPRLHSFCKIMTTKRMTLPKFQPP